MVLALVIGLLVAACGTDDEATDAPEPAEPAEQTEVPAEQPEAEPAETFTITFSSHVSPETAEMKIADWYMRRVEELTDGQVEFDEHYLGALVGGPDVFAAIQDGRTEAGFHVSFYQPAELPITQIAGIPFVTEDAEAYVRALGEMFATNDAFQEEFLSNGLRPLTFIHLSSATIGLKDPVDSYEGLSGRRIRSAGLLAPVLDAAGAEPVAMALGEVYEALQRGILDGWSSLALTPAMTSGLHEQAPYVHQPGTGMYLAPSFMINETYYQSLPESIRAAFEQAAQEVPEVGGQITMDTDALRCDELYAAGGEVVVWDQAEVDRWADVVGDSAAELWFGNVESAGGLTDSEARAFLDDLRALISQYEGTSSYEDGLRACAAANN